MDLATGGAEATVEDDLDDLYGDASDANGHDMKAKVQESKPAKDPQLNETSSHVQLPGLSGDLASTDHTVTEESGPSADITQSIPASNGQSNVLAEKPKAAVAHNDHRMESTAATTERHPGDAQSTPANTEHVNGSTNGLHQEPTTSAQPEWEADSSPYESSSDDSSDTTSSGSEDEYELLDPAEQARRLMEGDANSDGEGDSKGPKGAVIKSQNEQTEEPVVKPDITVTADMAIKVLGTAETVVDGILLIKAKVSGEYEVLESGSLLCLESRTVIGVVSETLGRVQEPLYCVRFSSAEEISETGIAAGTTIYYVPQHSTFVFTKALQAVKGSDASNIHDEEVGADEMEFSDDEAELAYKRSLKAQKRDRRLQQSGQRTNGYSQSRDGDGAEAPSYINYDDEPQDDLYTPLTRPPNLHEMMNQPSGPARGASGGFRGSRGRGDRRGDRGHYRSRGNRGRGQQHQDRSPAASQSHHFSPAAGSPGAQSPHVYGQPAMGMQPPGQPYGTPAGFNGGNAYAFPPPFNQAYQSQQRVGQYPTPQSAWPQQPGAQQHFGGPWPPQAGGHQQYFGQQFQHPPPPPPPRYGQPSACPSSPSFPQGAAINPRFFQPPLPPNQQYGR